MQTGAVAVTLAALSFLALILWRVRPAAVGALGWGPKRRSRRAALREAQARIESAADGPAKALALCDAADVLIAGRGIAGTSSASGLYLRAMRTDPRSVAVIARAAAGLASRPRTLESLLWRHLAVAGPWQGATRDASCASLDRLRALYEGPLRNPVRARAIDHVLGVLGETPGTNPSPSAPPEPA